MQSNEYKTLDSRAVAMELVLEALIKRLHEAGVVSTNSLIKDLAEIIDAPVSIKADPVNIKSMKASLINWKEYILQLS